TPDYVRQIQALGVRGLTPTALHTLKAAGVTPDYVRELAENGLADLSATEVWELAHSITSYRVDSD
ncbi:MAG TPA: hypothetical protein VGW38_19810, partial [Chloroflexota bacterium]|nr:hypothetical protein [Chloroflexota bacterium]